MVRPKGSKSNPNRKPLPFKQTDIERAIKGVEARRLPIHRIEIDPNTGKITIGTSPTGDVETVDLNQANPWELRGKKDD
jgi:hypothetical protein